MAASVRATTRWIVTIVLAVLASLLALVAIVARYARSEVLDTDRYVATVGPLASDPAVQEVVTARVSDRIIGRLDVEELTTDALDALVDAGAPDIVTGLAAPISDQVEAFVGAEVRRFVASDAFAELWTGLHRVAHEQLDALLTGDDEGAVQVEDGAVVLDLSTVVAAVKDRLTDRGFTPAERIPDDVDAELTIVESTRLERAQRGVQLLDRTATWLPWLLLGVGALAVLIAPERSRGLLVVAGGITLAMVLVAAALALARNWYVDNGTGDDVARDAALSIARTILAPLRTLLRAVLVLGAAVTLAAFLAGPSRAATGVRRSAAHAVGALRARAGGQRRPSAVEAWVGRNKAALRVTVVVTAALVCALWTYPSGAVVVAIVLAVLAGFVVIELLAADQAAVPSPAGGDDIPAPPT